MADIESVPSVITVDRHIYFYSAIDFEQSLKLIQALREADIQAQLRQIKYGGKLSPIELHINSYGGDAAAAFAVADYIATLKTPVHSVVEGIVASAAVILSRCCKKSYILPNSLMIIHQPAVEYPGSVRPDIEDSLDVLDHWTDALANFLTKHTSMSNKFVRKQLKRDTAINARKAIKWGLADKIRGE